jgi:hypothetical protein
MVIVRGGEGTAREAAHEIETTVIDIETAQDHATGDNVTTVTTVTSPEESGSRTTSAHHHCHARETTAGAAIQEADLHTRLRGGATRRDSR